MPLPRVEGRSSGGESQVELKSQATITLPASRTQQASTLTPALLCEWALELRRRLDRAEALVFLGLPDPSFALLAEEIHSFKACLPASPRRAAA